jgi:hypothetical protein
MLETDQAWNYFNDLTEFYFSYREATYLPAQLSFQSSKSQNGNRVRRGATGRKRTQIMPKEPKPRLAATRSLSSESSAPQHDAA